MNVAYNGQPQLNADNGNCNDVLANNNDQVSGNLCISNVSNNLSARSSQSSDIGVKTRSQRRAKCPVYSSMTRTRSRHARNQVYSSHRNLPNFVNPTTTKKVVPTSTKTKNVQIADMLTFATPTPVPLQKSIVNPSSGTNQSQPGASRNLFAPAFSNNTVGPRAASNNSTMPPISTKTTWSLVNNFNTVPRPFDFGGSTQTSIGHGEILSATPYNTHQQALPPLSHREPSNFHSDFKKLPQVNFNLQQKCAPHTSTSYVPPCVPTSQTSRVRLANDHAQPGPSNRNQCGSLSDVNNVQRRRTSSQDSTTSASPSVNESRRLLREKSEKIMVIKQRLRQQDEQEIQRLEEECSNLRIHVDSRSENSSKSSRIVDAFNPKCNSIEQWVEDSRTRTPKPEIHKTEKIEPFTPVFGEECQLTKRQLAARQVLGRDLLTFNGNAEEWPMFYSNFLQSTERCGYSNHENLIRLQRALKGKALEAVQGKLMTAACVPQIIDTLKMLYGRPDVIVQKLEQKLRKEPRIPDDRLDMLVSFALNLQNFCDTATAYDLDDYLINRSILPELEEKLPGFLQIQWGIYKETIPRVSLVVFSQWLFKIGKVAYNVVIPKLTHSGSNTDAETRSKPKIKSVFHINQDEKTSQPSEKLRYPCFKCGKDHRLAECSVFKQLSVDGRWDVLKKKGLCRKCFGRHHFDDCKSKRRCSIDGCHRRHHELLHSSSRETKTNTETPDDKNEDSQPKKSVFAQIHCHSRNNSSAIFRIVPISLHGPNKSIRVYAFLDEGSQITLMEDALADELGIQGPAEELCIGWTSEISRQVENSRRLSVEVSATYDHSKRFELKGVRTVDDLNLPVQTLDTKFLNQFAYLNGLPISTYTNAKPRILIGVDNYKIGVPLKTVEGEWNQPIAAKTRIGWTVYGRTGEIGGKQFYPSFHICQCQSDGDSLHDLVNNFFSLENFGVSPTAKAVESNNDRRARHLMETTTIRVGNFYETGLLWKHDTVSLPNSFPMAMRRLQCLEAKIGREKGLGELLNSRIAEYLAKGYIKKLEPQEIPHSPKNWYLPIFTVTNEIKNKVRIVWDAAAKVGDTSLNSNLLKGPDQLKSLPGILYRFREHRIAICGDIREMFHQVRVRTEDQPAQMFLWRNGDQTRNPDVYKMLVMTFGASCSPCLAQHVKNTNANRFATEMPRAVTAIINNHYVDDWLDSVSDEGEMISLVEQVKHIHKDGGFTIRNWLSNSERVLQSVGESSESTPKNIGAMEGNSEKVLGMWWIPSEDCFTFKFNHRRIDIRTISGERVPSKRQVLQTIMTIYDPLGFIAFYVVFAKVLMQDIWRSGIEWDDPIPEDLNEKWVAWTQRLTSMVNVRVPRCYSLVHQSTDIQLHVFVDASMKAYATVAYLVVDSCEGKICALIGSKTKVAPNKPTSVPRLELLAAVLGSRFAASIQREHTLPIARRIFWSDSQNVLSWVRSDARNYKQFVSFRIGEIRELTKVQEWRWVPTSQNVADEATKWSSTPEIENDSRWFNGPKFLLDNEQLWPTNDIPPSQTYCEQINVHTLLEKPPPCADAKDFSSWTRYIRVHAVVLRFCRNILAKHRKQESIKVPLLFEELKDAETRLYKICQSQSFPSEVAALRSGKDIDENSKWRRYSPYLDDDGVVRMYGRLDEFEGLCYDAKRPIILDGNHGMTKLIMEHYHRMLHHQCHETALHELRQKYRIPRLRPIMTALRQNCQFCKNRLAKPSPPQMGNLPLARLSPFTPPFSFTGIDYFGPIEVVVGRRVEKRWGVIFTCFCIRGVYLDVVHSLTTDSCLMSINRFMSRRGPVKEFYTDNGTNFRGASKELRAALNEIDGDRIQRSLSTKTKWSFIPPASPHMGGCWERLIRPIKSILTELMVQKRPTDEQLLSYFAEIEYTINSRPLTHVPIDSHEHDALTPNDLLLIGKKNTLESIVTDDGPTQRRKWKVVQHISNTFWRRWIREYLPEICRRTKWYDNQRSLEIGDVVIIVDENAPRNTWVKGLVECVHQGKDGKVRSADVRTQRGLLTRPTIKLAVLDVKRDDSLAADISKHSQSGILTRGEDVE